MGSLWSALVGGAVGAVVAAVGTFWQSWVAAKVKVDESLRGKREKDYVALWQLTGILPAWPKAAVTYAELDDRSRALRDWYFAGGGIYLSVEARAAYGAAQQALRAAIEAAADPAAQLEGDYDRLQAALSALRTELTRDLLSRERSALSFLDGHQRASRW
jgi:hypothetical protein